MLLYSVDGGDANNWPLRGGKKTEFEGGVRINAFLSGGFIPQSLRGVTKDGYVHVCDWYATLLPLAGASSSDDHPGIPAVDGLDMWPYRLRVIVSSNPEFAPAFGMFFVTH